MTLKTINLASPAHLVPSGIVHHVAYVQRSRDVNCMSCLVVAAKQGGR